MAEGKNVITDTRELTVLANKLNSFNLTPNKKQSLLHSIAVEVKTQTEERFELQESHDGAKWQNISERTRAYYSKRGLLKGSLLNRTRQLRDSLTTKSDSVIKRW